MYTNKILLITVINQCDILTQLYLWWVDSKTYLELTRPWFSSRLPFPLNFYLPLKKHKDYVNYLNQAYNADNLTETEREQKVRKLALYLSLLSVSIDIIIRKLVFIVFWNHLESLVSK